MNQIWSWIFRASGICLCAAAVIFLSVNRESRWKEIAGVACALFGTICVVAVRITKNTEAANELQMVNQEIRRHPPTETWGRGHEGHEAHDGHADHD